MYTLNERIFCNNIAVLLGVVGLNLCAMKISVTVQSSILRLGYSGNGLLQHLLVVIRSKHWINSQVYVPIPKLVNY